VSAFVLDTNPVLYYAWQMDRRLGRKARAAFAAFDAGETTLYVPAPVVQETWYLHQAQRLGATTPRGFWEAFARPELIHADLTQEDIFVASELRWGHRDSFDRLIVAIAHRLELPLITGDQEITRWGGVDVVW
jgi:PIN domain nuclease of toxin-antitoxin system